MSQVLHRSLLSVECFVYLAYNLAFSMLLSEMINSLVWRLNPKTRLCAASQAKTYDSAVEHLLPDPLQPGESGTFFHTTQPFQQLSWYPRQVPSCRRSVRFVTDVVHTYHITNPTAGTLTL